MAKTQAHQQYKNTRGEKVPGVTTILGILAKPALIPWAWGLGRDGIDLRKAQEQAMDIGSLTHAMIEAHLKGEQANTSEYSKTQIDVAETAFLAFLEWEKGQGLVTISSEVQMVHETLGYGGTADWIAGKENGEVWLIDFKTSKDGACYPEYKYQVAAYRNLWESLEGKGINRCIILCLNKETGLPTPHQIEDTRRYFEIFDHCRQIYELRKER